MLLAFSESVPAAVPPTHLGSITLKVFCHSSVSSTVGALTQRQSSYPSKQEQRKRQLRPRQSLRQDRATLKTHFRLRAQVVEAWMATDIPGSNIPLFQPCNRNTLHQCNDHLLKRMHKRHILQVNIRFFIPLRR